MNFFELKDISEVSIELVNPFSQEKVLHVGAVLGLNRGDQIIDFGCGYGEWLRLWAENFGISGVGIDIRATACERARKKMLDHGLDDRIEIICENASSYTFDEGRYDVACCVGASFIWGGYLPSIRGMKQAIKPSGKLVIGEVYWKRTDVPSDIISKEDFHFERDLLKLSREESFEIEYVERASQGDWDRYESENWKGLLTWIQENPDHPDKQQVVDHLHQSQDEYFQYGREYFGWAVYIITPESK
jgi:SAM-dependent methyltransferase